MVRREEVIRLIALATEESYVAEEEEVRATVDHGSSVSDVHRCAVCLFPTTTRCAQCKSVRYWFVFLSQLKSSIAAIRSPKRKSFGFYLLLLLFWFFVVQASVRFFIGDEVTRMNVDRLLFLNTMEKRTSLFSLMVVDTKYLSFRILLFEKIHILMT